MPLLEDIGAGLEEFGRAFGQARRFRYERQMKEQAQQLEKLRTDIALANLKEDQLSRERKQQIDFQMQQLAERWNTAFNDPLARETEGIARGTLRQKVYDELSQITANMIALDPNRGEQFLGLTERHYFDPLERKRLEQANYQPSELERRVGFLKQSGVQLTPDELKKLAGIKEEESETVSDVADIAPFIKTLEEQGLNPLEIAKVPDAIIKDTFKNYVKQRRELEKTTKPKGLSFTTPSRPIQGTTVNYPQGPAIPAEGPIVNEPQDTVEVDINDPRLKDTSFTESPFGIDVNAKATAEDEPASEDEVRQYVEEYKVGKKPFPTYKVARQYFKRALEKGFTTKKFYDTFHSKFISPMYPDTTK